MTETTSSKSVVVTGASSGIGASTVLELDRAGFTVFAAVRDPVDAEPLQRGSSGRLQVLALDVTDAASVAAAVARVREHVGDSGLAGVVNVAGIGVPGPFELITPEQLRAELDVNVVGQVALTQALLPLLRPAKGRIVFVGSIGGLAAVQFAGAYHASKFAMEAVADAWRQELEPEGLAVVLIQPGPIATPIWAKAAQDVEALLTGDHPETPRYAERLRSFQDSLRAAAKNGASPATVAETIREALTTGSPRNRYAVGGPAKLVAALAGVVPKRLIDMIGRRAAT